MSKLGLPYVPSISMDKNKFGQVLYSILFYWLIIKLNIIRDTFKWRISLGRAAQHGGDGVCGLYPMKGLSPPSKPAPIQKKIWKNFLVRYWYPPVKVCKIPNMVMVVIFFLWLGRDFFMFLVIPEKILHLKVSLIIFILVINQLNPNKSKKTSLDWSCAKLKLS